MDGGGLKSCNGNHRKFKFRFTGRQHNQLVFLYMLDIERFPMRSGNIAFRLFSNDGSFLFYSRCAIRAPEALPIVSDRAVASADDTEKCLPDLLEAELHDGSRSDRVFSRVTCAGDTTAVYRSTGASRLPRITQGQTQPSDIILSSVANARVSLPLGTPKLNTRDTACPGGRPDTPGNQWLSL